MKVQFSGSSQESFRPASVAEMGALTYEAMGISDDIVLLLECDGRADTKNAIVIGVNEAFRRASGYRDAQILGRALTDLFVSETQAQALTNAIRETGSLRSELSCTRADGSHFTLGMHLMPAPARTPGKGCFVVLGRDITAALQAKQLQDSIQRLLAKVFTSVDVAVTIVDGAGRTVMANPHADSLLGYKPNGTVGRNSLELLAPDARASATAAIAQQFKDGKDATYTAPLLRPDGSQMVIRFTSVMVALGGARQFRIVTLRPGTAEATAMRSEGVGRIRLVGLDEVRAALGDRWPEVAGRCMATAEAVIKRNCGPQDSFSRADDTSFLMCFGALSEAESSFRAAMIGREIRNRLIGQGEDPDNAYVRSVAAVVRFPDVPQSKAALHNLLLDGLDKQMERLEAEARQTIHGALTNAVCKIEPVLGPAPGKPVAYTVFLPGELERQLVSALATLPPQESQAFDLDGLLLGLAAQQSVVSLGRGDATPLMVELRFDIFTTRTATERFFALCAKINPRVASRLVLLLSSLPGGLPRSRLQDCTNRLRPYCSAVGFQLNELAELSRLDLSNGFNQIVAFPMAACAASSPGKLKEIFSSLQTQRTRVMIREVTSEKEATTLRSLGADMISMKRSENSPDPAGVAASR